MARTSTLRAFTKATIAVVHADEIERSALADLSLRHHREDGGGRPRATDDATETS